MSGNRDAALNNVLNRLRAFLHEHEFGDFTDADAFANVLLDELDTAWGRGWAARSVRTSIAGAVRESYLFYRLRDTTVFGEGSPIRLRLGGPDKVSIRFIEELDHFYFSKFADNTSEPLRKFFIKQYFEDGAALFGRESSEEMAAFRDAAGEKLKNLTDRQTTTIVQTAVQRVRNWAHIGTMDQARIELARLVATIDKRTSNICLALDGKLVRVGVAFDAIQRLNKLTPADFAAEVYESDLGQQMNTASAVNIKEFLEDDGKTIKDEFTKIGRGFPPFHPNCRTRMEGVIEGVEEEN